MIFFESYTAPTNFLFMSSFATKNLLGPGSNPPLSDWLRAKCTKRRREQTQWRSKRQAFSVRYDKKEWKLAPIRIGHFLAQKAPTKNMENRAKVKC